MSSERFAALAETALVRIPAGLTALIDNVVLFIEDEAPADDPDLLGFYDGIPLTERDSRYGGAVPDRIVLCRGPILDMCESEAEVIDEIRITLVHEIAHHFGIEDDRLHELGYA